MPVACPRATGATPATAAATSNATSRPMASLPEKNSERETGYPGRPASFRRARRLEPNAAREDHLVRVPHHAADLEERRDAAPHPDRRAREDIQVGVRAGRAKAARRDRRVRDIQAAAAVGPERAPGGDAEPVGEVSIDLPEVLAGARGRTTWEVVVERHDAVERRSGEQRLETEHRAAPNAEVRLRADIELQAELRALCRPSRCRARGAPLGGAERRVCRKHHEEQRTADALPHVEASRCL